MEESKEQQSQHRFLQAAIYLSVALEVFYFIYGAKLMQSQSYKGLDFFITRLGRLKIYEQPHYSKLFTLILICLVSVGTLSKKQKDFNPKKSRGLSISLRTITVFWRVMVLRQIWAACRLRAELV